MCRRVKGSEIVACSMIVFVMAIGCSQDSESGAVLQKTAANATPASQSKDAAAETGQAGDRAAHEFQPIQLVGGEVEADAAGRPAEPRVNAEPVEIVLQALQPLQSLVGEWRGTTHRTIGGFGNVEEIQWQWDFLTDEEQPALIVNAVSSPSYFQSGRLTYLVDEGAYQFVGIDRNGVAHQYRGTWSAPVQHGSSDTHDTTHQLDLVQTTPATGGRLARLVIQQRTPDRYSVEYYNLADGDMDRFDTVTARRQGSSPSNSADERRSNACPVSGGQGHVPFEYGGKTYWFCCAGCKAAFEQRPEWWLARHEQRLDRP